MVKHHGNRDNKAKIAKPFKGGTYPRLSRGIVHFFSAPEMFKENTRL
jgi:hypothetical protein